MDETTKYKLLNLINLNTSAVIKSFKKNVKLDFDDTFEHKSFALKYISKCVFCNDDDKNSMISNITNDVYFHISIKMTFNLSPTSLMFHLYDVNVKDFVDILNAFMLIYYTFSSMMEKKTNIKHIIIINTNSYKFYEMGKPFTVKGINSGVTFKSDNIILIWKIDELVRTFIHESIHCLGLDVYFKTTSISTEINEGYTEMLTMILMLKIKSSMINHVNRIECEIKHHLLSNIEIFEKSKTNTNIMSYVILKNQMFKKRKKILDMVLDKDYTKLETYGQKLLEKSLHEPCFNDDITTYVNDNKKQFTFYFND